MVRRDGCATTVTLLTPLSARCHAGGAPKQYPVVPIQVTPSACSAATTASTSGVHDSGPCLPIHAARSKVGSFIAFSGSASPWKRSGMTVRRPLRAKSSARSYTPDERA